MPFVTLQYLPVAARIWNTLPDNVIQGPSQNFPFFPAVVSTLVELAAVFVTYIQTI